MNTPTAAHAVTVSVRDLAVWMDQSLLALEKIGLGRVTLPQEATDSPSDLLLLQGQEAIRQVVGGLQQAGAPAPERAVVPPSANSDLAALADLASPQVQARLQDLIDALKGILPVAEALDKARGHWMPEAEEWGETPGTDAAEAIHQMICRYELQLDAPKGRD